MRFVAFDTETTGVLPGVDKIVELGAVLFNQGEVEAVFSTLVDPRVPIPEQASRINKITDDMVKGKPYIEDLLEPFAEFCGEHPMVAHNAIFDYQFISSVVDRHQTRAPRGAVLDTYPMAKKIFPGLPNYKLGTLVQHLGIPNSDFHRAEEDATYCGRVLLNIVKKITGSEDWPPFENLVALTGRARLIFPQYEPQPKQLQLDL